MGYQAGITAAVTVALCALSACGRALESGGQPTDAEPSHEAVVETWRAQHEENYRRDYATIAGLHALKEGANTVGSGASNDVVLPASTPASVGRFVLAEGRVRFEPDPAAGVQLRGERVTTAIDLRSDSEPDTDVLVVGDVSMVVHPSGAAQMIRVRDPQGPLARGFLGFTWFPIDPQYRVVGRFNPDAQPERVRVPNTFGQIDEMTTEGVVEFTLLGETVRLRPFTTRPKRLWFVFRDASSGEETYEAARFLYADLRDDGTVVLDFNMAYNPPCAFNPYTTCPIPLPENRLPMKILAGERDYPVKVSLPDPAG
jgi:uncharacterized protein (DUF1684 family)